MTTFESWDLVLVIRLNYILKHLQSDYSYLFIDCIMIAYYSHNSNKLVIIYWLSLIPLFHILSVRKRAYRLYTFRKSSRFVDIHTNNAQ